MARKAKDDKVILIVTAPLPSFTNVVDLESCRPESPANATSPRALDHHPINQLRVYFITHTQPFYQPWVE
jgi:hypothetical protein